jgi:transcriptional regulator with XRE-family HTH domain
MWTASKINHLRQQLGMDAAAFAKLMGVDARTVRRWESGEARPTGSAEAVMSGIDESLAKDPSFASVLVGILVGAAAVGGLAYVLVKLIDHLRDQDR